ncbi:MAG TPA: hypothetical protein DEQ09_06425 [Bacteroidales bacterium]|nr:hypothetical protein [Bacteroidales bacterium]
MKKALLAFTILMILSCTYAQKWEPAGDKLKTEWAEKINPSNPLPEYPRPMMVRDEWKNLNGLWKYAITEAGTPKPEKFDGKILVPFAVESSLSGVQKTVSPENELWYEYSFTVPSAWKKKRILLNFGAVDWESDIWINDIKVGTHKGGYTPFSFDISPFLKESGEQILLVKVWDPTDKGYQPRGK